MFRTRNQDVDGARGMGIAFEVEGGLVCGLLRAIHPIRVHRTGASKSTVNTPQMGRCMYDVHHHNTTEQQDGEGVSQKIAVASTGDTTLRLVTLSDCLALHLIDQIFPAPFSCRLLLVIHPIGQN